MSSRDATITIRNRTGCTMEKYPSSYGGEDNPYVKDGQITSGPPSTIGDQQNGTLKVEKSSDLSLVGPEGWVVYQIDDGGEKPLVKLTWNHPDNDAPSTYSVVPLDDRVSGTTTDQSGDHDQTVNLNVNYTPYFPNGWDIVLQLSQGLINASLLGAFGHKTSFVAPTDPGMDTSGDTWLGLQVDKMDTPQVKIVQGGGSSVELWLWFTKGTLYYSSGGQRVSQALSNTQVVVTVDLSLAQVEDDAAFAASDPKVQAQLAGLEEQRMSVWAIYLDLRDPDRATGLRVLDSSGAAVSWPSAAVSTLGAALATWGRTSPPAPLVGIGRYDLSGALPPGALLVPTSFEYHTTWVAGSGGAEGSDASTLDVFMMTNRRASPANSGRYVMPAFGPDDTSTARISMSKRAVDEGFVGADLVPQIQAALVASLASVASAEI
ncbi:MAG TPA: hypothetical protein PKA64_18100 [Myxococcota bacterium]|nr:hypothetical protein [Myxococcota bacterium]